VVGKFNDQLKAYKAAHAGTRARAISVPGRQALRLPPKPFSMQAATLITPRLAEEAISSRLTCLPIESLPLTQCVGGTLRENIYAERDQPPFDRVAMDGIAVDSEACARRRRFRIQGTQAAGAPPLKLTQPASAIEVMTGAMLPLGCDCVIPVEQSTSPTDFATQLRAAVVALPQRASPRQHGRQGALLLESARCCGRRKSRSRPRPAWRGCGSAASRPSWWSRPAMS
jgi:hypothetical protein